MDISDKRVTTGEDADGDELEDEGLYAGTRGPSPFRANRGTYHFSRYSFHRYSSFAGEGYVAPIPILTTAEMDFLHAEALLHQGKGDESAAIMDKYHADLGGYPSSVGTAIAVSYTHLTLPTILRV